MKTAPEVRLRLLGGFSLASPDEPIRLPTKKAEAALAYLAWQPDTPQSREKLATLLWGDSGEAQARQSLRQTLFTLRRALPSRDLLNAEGDRISLDSDRFDIDISHLRELLDRDDLDSLRKASALYTGPLLDGFSTGEDEFDLWVDREREALRERVLNARMKLLERIAPSGGDEPVVLALSILSEDPLRESVHRALMRLYAAAGRRTAAVRQFQTCSDVLWKRLAVRPSGETRELYESIMREEVAAGERDDDASGTHVMPRRTSEARHILLVEDNRLNQEVVRAALNSTRYELTVVDDGAAALLELGRRRFDLALIDIELPFVDGFTLIGAMKKNGIDLPVIVLTSHHETEHEVSALSLGADDFLRKPVQKDVLLMRIERALRQAEHSAG